MTHDLHHHSRAHVQGWTARSAKPDEATPAPVKLEASVYKFIIFLPAAFAVLIYAVCATVVWSPWPSYWPNFAQRCFEAGLLLAAFGPVQALLLLAAEVNQPGYEEDDE